MYPLLVGDCSKDAEICIRILSICLLGSHGTTLPGVMGLEYFLLRELALACKEPGKDHHGSICNRALGSTGPLEIHGKTHDAQKVVGHKMVGMERGLGPSSEGALLKTLCEKICSGLGSIFPIGNRGRPLSSEVQMEEVLEGEQRRKRRKERKRGQRGEICRLVCRNALA